MEPKEPQQVIQCHHEGEPNKARRGLRSCFDSACESNWVLNIHHLQNWFNDHAGSIEVVNRSPINMETLAYGLHQWSHDVTDISKLPMIDSALLVSSLFQLGFMAGFFSQEKEKTEKPQ